LLKVGLTGGIASGKSVVADMMAQRGALVLHADQLAHRLMEPGQPVYQSVVEHFGEGILQADGRIDRQKLAAAAFGEAGRPSRIPELNRIVHPAVIREQEVWLSEIGKCDPHAVAVVEAALIVEAGITGYFDKIVLVTCRPEQRAARLAQRLGLDLRAAEAEVARRMAEQVPDEQKAAFADYVIDNSGALADTAEQVAHVFGELKQQA
jgi:dephospho-CoA kinase